MPGDLGRAAPPCTRRTTARPAGRSLLALRRPVPRTWPPPSTPRSSPMRQGRRGRRWSVSVRVDAAEADGHAPEARGRPGPRRLAVFECCGQACVDGRSRCAMLLNSASRKPGISAMAANSRRADDQHVQVGQRRDRRVPRPGSMAASSPKKSPGPRVLTRRPPWVTATRARRGSGRTPGRYIPRGPGPPPRRPASARPGVPPRRAGPRCSRAAGRRPAAGGRWSVFPGLIPLVASSSDAAVFRALHAAPVHPRAERCHSAPRPLQRRCHRRCGVPG